MSASIPLSQWAPANSSIVSPNTPNQNTQVVQPCAQSTSTQSQTSTTARSNVQFWSQFSPRICSAYTAIGLLVTIVLTGVTFVPTNASWRLGKWTAQKDYIDYCIQMNVWKPRVTSLRCSNKMAANSGSSVLELRQSPKH